MSGSLLVHVKHLIVTVVETEMIVLLKNRNVWSKKNLKQRTKLYTLFTPALIFVVQS